MTHVGVRPFPERPRVEDEVLEEETIVVLQITLPPEDKRNSHSDCAENI